MLYKQQPKTFEICEMLNFSDFIKNVKIFWLFFKTDD